MLVNPLKRPFVIESVDGALERTCREPGVWNVLSILGPDDLRPSFTGAKRVMPLAFDDMEQSEDVREVALVQHDDVARAFRFWHETEGEPMLVHCLAGVSRSTGLSLALITRALWKTPQAEKRAVRLLLQVRPQAMPNGLVLRLGLEQFLSRKKAAEITGVLIYEVERQAGR